VTLSERLLNDEVRPHLVKDCCAIIDRQVSSKRGLSGIALKTAYSSVKAIKRGFVPGVVDALLDEWIEKVAQFESEHAAKGDGSHLADYLIQERGRVAEALLQVTDVRAERTKHKIAKKFYLRQRPNALKNVEDGIDDLAGLVTKYETGTVAQAS
jgi:hypothetical protein